jgi:hypothetical protein
MAPIDFCDLSVEQEEYLVELLCTRGACTVDWFARELDELCRASAARAHSPHGRARAKAVRMRLPPR